MHDEAPPREASPATADRPDEALKKTPAPSKGGKAEKEKRLAAALRENLRRRKAAGRKETD